MIFSYIAGIYFVVWGIRKVVKEGALLTCLQKRSKRCTVLKHNVTVKPQHMSYEAKRAVNQKEHYDCSPMPLVKYSADLCP